MPSAAHALERAVAAHRERWGEPDRVVRAPGRVNLIGEHTDYNDGFTLPMALPFDNVLAMSDHGDLTTGPVTVTSEGFGEESFDPTADPTVVAPWARHIAGAAHLLGHQAVATGGWRATVATDIPTGASLSSSAAIQVATITALLDRAGTEWPPIDVARLGQRVENEVIGLSSGIMDQFISAGAVAGHASLMDCRAFTLTPTPLPAGVVIAVMDTGTRRVLADAAYDDRRAACQQAVATLGIDSLRDAGLDVVATIGDPVVRRRAHHVVAEIERTIEAAAALADGEIETFGRLMSASHVSLRDGYEVSAPALDHIVDIAESSSGCLGARMTGGGFAGCAVALVRADDADAFRAAVTTEYVFEGHRAVVWICSPGAGAAMVPATDWPRGTN